MNVEIARRAVDCKGWLWMPGMRYTLPTTSLHGRWKPGLSPHIMPDLTDPATLGCLLALAREAWDDCEAFVGRRAGSWTFETLNPLAPLVTASTEAEALVAALEAAP